MIGVRPKSESHHRPTDSSSLNIDSLTSMRISDVMHDAMRSNTARNEDLFIARRSRR